MSSPSGDEPTIEVVVDPEQFELRVGATLGDVRLVEPVETGTKISCWRAERRAGGQATVHALMSGASERERDTFLRAANRLASLHRDRPVAGLVPVESVVPDANIYIAYLSVSGSMADVPALG